MHRTPFHFDQVELLDHTVDLAGILGPDQQVIDFSLNIFVCPPYYTVQDTVILRFFREPLIVCFPLQGKYLQLRTGLK